MSGESASRDLIRIEASITGLLPGTRDRRERLLARLADYSAAAIREARRLGPIEPSNAERTHVLEWLLRPVFICGHHRSGTTLLQSLLDGHPQVLVLPSEGTYFKSFTYVARNVPTIRDMDRFAAEWIERFVDPNFEPHFRLGMSDASRTPAIEFARSLFGWHPALRGRVPSELVALLALAAAFRTTTAPSSAPHVWVEKTPRNEHYVGRLAALAGARFIQVVRDPQATLASLAAIYGANRMAFDAAAHARDIGRSLHLALENSRAFVGRYLVVRYEDLVDDPAREVERVRQFLGIAPDATLSVPTADGRPVRANSSFSAGEAGIIERMRHTIALPAEHSLLLGAYAGHAASAFGYRLAKPAFLRSSAVRLRHWPRHAVRSSRGALGSVMRSLAVKRGGGGPADR